MDRKLQEQETEEAEKLEPLCQPPELKPSPLHTAANKAHLTMKGLEEKASRRSKCSVNLALRESKRMQVWAKQAMKRKSWSSLQEAASHTAVLAKQAMERKSLSSLQMAASKAYISTSELCLLQAEPAGDEIGSDEQALKESKRIMVLAKEAWERKSLSSLQKAASQAYLAQDRSGEAPAKLSASQTAVNHAGSELNRTKQAVSEEPCGLEVHGVETGLEEPTLSDVALMPSSSLQVAGTAEQTRSCMNAMTEKTLSQKMHYDLAQIQDRYMVDQDKVVEGGFGSIFVGRTISTAVTSSDVAIKYCPVDEEHSTAMMIDREVEALTRYQGTNGIAQLCERIDGKFGSFIIMELCKGKDLERHVQATGGPVDSITCKTISAQLFSVLRLMHADNVIHRDIKPSNVMYYCDGGSTRTTLVDLGICFALETGTTLKSASGTPGYWAPEVHDQTSAYYAQGYDTRADLFSAGKTIYFIARGATYDESKLEDEKWDGMDFWLKHFLRNLMQVTPSLRMSADEAMQHPFVAGVSFRSVATTYTRDIKRFFAAKKDIALIFLAFLLVALFCPQQ